MSPGRNNARLARESLINQLYTLLIITYDFRTVMKCVGPRVRRWNGL